MKELKMKEFYIKTTKTMNQFFSIVLLKKNLVVEKSGYKIKKLETKEFT